MKSKGSKWNLVWHGRFGRASFLFGHPNDQRLNEEDGQPWLS